MNNRNADGGNIGPNNEQGKPDYIAWPGDVETLAKNFAQLFVGNEASSGTYSPGMPHYDAGKLKWKMPKPLTVPGAASRELWEKHLMGQRYLGVIPIREDGTVKNGSIDVDDYQERFSDLPGKIAELGLPLVADRSKSGGLHLRCFVSEPVPASQMRAALMIMAFELGLAAGIEIFPKQSSLSDTKKGVGNWIGAPYFGRTFGCLARQAGLDGNSGDELTPAEYLEAARASTITSGTLTGYAEQARRAGLVTETGRAAKPGRPGKASGASGAYAPVSVKDLGVLNGDPFEKAWGLPLLGKPGAVYCLRIITEGCYSDFPDATEKPDRSRAVWFVTCRLVACGVPDPFILGILTETRWKISEHVRDQDDPLTYARQQIAKAHNDLGTVPFVANTPNRPDRTATIMETILLRNAAPIYVRVGAGQLVRPVLIDHPAADKRMTVTAAFDNLDSTTLTDAIAPLAEFRQYDGRSKDWKTVSPPALPLAILIKRRSWKLRPVVGVTTTPLLRFDGSVFSEPGYDPETSVYLMPDPRLKLPDMSKKPSKDDALEAVEKVVNPLLAEFAFKGDLDRSVAYSALLTGLLRSSMLTAPAHLIRAPQRGSGKTYLVDVVVGIATGRWAPAITLTKNHGDTEIASVVLSGMPFINFDNLEGEIGGPALCVFTERPVVAIRVLGKSQIIEVASRAAVFATGKNDVVPREDIIRRVLVCDLDPKMERAELRKFKAHPVESMTPEARGRYMAALLTISRAYLLDEEKLSGNKDYTPLGSYGEWDMLVRAPLVWLGLNDPVQSMEAAHKADPAREAIVELFEQWTTISLLKGNRVRARELKELAEKGHRKDKDDPESQWVRDYPDLHDLLLRVAGERGRISTKALGWWLKGIAGQVVNDMRLSATTVSDRQVYAMDGLTADAQAKLETPF
jgi:putative DNA primase/helicase